MSKADANGADSILGISDITDNKSLWRMLVAECLGTLLLVVVGCGSIIQVNEEAAPPSIVQIALTFGIMIASIVQCIGHISGGHINPAITVSFFITGEIKLLRALLFIISQCIGAAAGSGVLWLATPDRMEGTLGGTSLAANISPMQGVLVEVVLTFVLTFVVHAVCDSRRKDLKGSAPLAIGLSAVACHLSGIQFTGSSINPARSFGPAALMNSWTLHWVYWVGPIIGSVIGGLIYKFMFKATKCESDSYDF